MHAARLKLGRKKGFTIVELLVVIVVIGILTTIVIVSYGAWQTSTRTAQVKSDLSGAAQTMESGRTFNNTTGGYPATLTFTSSSGVNLSLYSSVATSYCINGNSTADTSIQYYIDSLTGSKGPQAGTCQTRTNLPVPGTPTGLVAGSTLDTSSAFVFTQADAYALAFNVQCSTDQAFVGGIVTGTGLNSPVSVTGLATQTTYYCRVQGSNNAGSSAWSSYVTITTLLSPPAGGILAITASTTQINYAFSLVSGAASYNVQRATNSTFTTGVATNSQTSNLGSFSGLSANTIYYFRVQSVDGSSNPGPYSTIAPYAGSSGAPASETTQPITTLVVAGGGGGGGNCNSCAGAGGGGAGGLLYSTSIFAGATGSTVSVTVGGGGSGGSGTNTVGVGDGANGGSSSFTGAAMVTGLSALGGGGGRAQNGGAGGSGGSGGGGSGGSSPAAGVGGAGTAGQGNSGGSGVQAGALNGGSGGGAGGAGATGASASGGAGLAYSISGASLFYAGGGGAGEYTTNTPGNGGSGVGGNGANSSINSGKGFPGTANRGGGGGGGNGSTIGAGGGNGGSGVVIFSYPTGSMTTSGGTVTTSGGNTIVTFTTSGTLTFVSFP